MLRVYRHYVAAAVLTLVAGDLIVTALAMLSAQKLGYWNPHGALWFKTAVLAGVTALTLYLADLYKTDFRIRRVETTSRLFIALATAATMTAAIGFAIPSIRLGRLAFLHVFGVLAL